MTSNAPADRLSAIEDRARDAWAETLRLSRQSCEHLLDHRFGEVVFRSVRDASLVERLEERRLAVIEATPRAVH